VRTSIALYFLFLLAIGAGRLVEMQISKRNRARLLANGATTGRDPHFGAMVVLHTGILIAAFLEAWLLDRPFIPALALPMIVLFIACNLLRWWVIRTLAGHWNVRVMDSRALGVVTSGPYRFIRHPNYAAVFLELLAVPLIHTAYLTAIIGLLLHLWVLSGRIRAEEAVLLANPEYVSGMGRKPRFIPGLL